jgi:hypothetical protein
MGTLRRPQPVAAALLLLLLLSACASLASTRWVLLRRPKPIGSSSPALQSASAEDLAAIIARTRDVTHALAPSAPLAPFAGAVYRGRVRASLPVGGTFAFDMAANASTFRVNRENEEFITGLTPPSSLPLFHAGSSLGPDNGIRHAEG